MILWYGPQSWRLPTSKLLWSRATVSTALNLSLRTDRNTLNELALFHQVAATPWQKLDQINHRTVAARTALSHESWQDPRVPRGKFFAHWPNDSGRSWAQWWCFDRPHLWGEWTIWLLCWEGWWVVPAWPDETAIACENHASTARCCSEGFVYWRIPLIRHAEVRRPDVPTGIYGLHGFRDSWNTWGGQHCDCSRGKNSGEFNRVDEIRSQFQELSLLYPPVRLALPSRRPQSAPTRPRISIPQRKELQTNPLAVWQLATTKECKDIGFQIISFQTVFNMALSWIDLIWFNSCPRLCVDRNIGNYVVSCSLHLWN